MLDVDLTVNCADVFRGCIPICSKPRVVCEICGKSITRNNKKRHQQTKKCKAKLNNNHEI